MYKSRQLITNIFLLVIGESVLLIGYYLLTPSDQNNIFWIKYSLSRIILLSLIFIVLLLIAFIYFYLRGKSETTIYKSIENKRTQIHFLILAGYSISTLLSISDSFWKNEYVGYLYRLRPTFIYFAMIFIQLIIGFILLEKGKDHGFRFKNSVHRLLKLYIFISGLFIFSKPFWPKSQFSVYDHISLSFKLIFVYQFYFIYPGRSNPKLGD